MNIILGVTGGIAAYKACELLRLLTKSGHEVKVIMTEGSKNFIHPNTFAALSHHPVHDDLFSDPMLHIQLAKWADKIIIAPATASILSELAVGAARQLLSAVCLASEAPCFIAPAMNKIMWEKSITQKNIATLISFAYHIIPPEIGEQACGDIGAGRMAAPEIIFKKIFPPHPMTRVVITAGPTREKIDPVRYISNFSSGKMGYALAKAAYECGAEVHLITGPTALPLPHYCKVTSVISTQEMLAAAIDAAKNADIFISAAAVADYQVQTFSDEKIKKNELTLLFKKNQDMLKIIRAHHPTLFTVGFCAETHNLLEQANKKLIEKNLDVIIANKIDATGYPFDADTNELIYLTQKETIALEKDTKENLAKKIISLLFCKLGSNP